MIGAEWLGGQKVHAMPFQKENSNSIWRRSGWWVSTQEPGSVGHLPARSQVCLYVLKHGKLVDEIAENVVEKRVARDILIEHTTFQGNTSIVLHALFVKKKNSAQDNSQTGNHPSGHRPVSHFIRPTDLDD